MQDTVTEAPSPPSGRHRARRPRWGLWVSLVLLIALVAAGLGAVRYYDWCQQADGVQRPVTIRIDEGASGSEVVDQLQERGVIRCGLVSKWLLRRDGTGSDIRAGSFELTTNMTPQAAFDVLTAPVKAAPTVRLTIPEGYRLTQIADRVEEVTGIPAKTFLRTADDGDYSLPPYLPKDASSLEGFLFPNTYQLLKKGTTADDVIRKLLDEFGTEAASLPWQNAKELGVTPYEVVTIASMIEKEAKLDRERPLIAGVIYNRLKLGMQLGIDATLLYDDPTPDGQLSTSDIETDTPYNTRIRTGLPPTPIASPGLKSLEAALNPAHTDYLYYVLCGADGHHVFAKTLAQHNANRVACGE
jgi:peptidoglycan lytic transglycosylase G